MLIASTMPFIIDKHAFICLQCGILEIRNLSSLVSSTITKNLSTSLVGGLYL